MLDGCARKQMTSLAGHILSDMESSGIAPSSHTLGLIFILYAQPYQPARTCVQTPQDVMARSRPMRLSTPFYSPDA